MNKKLKRIGVFVMLVAPLLSLCTYNYHVPYWSPPNPDFINSYYWKIKGNNSLLKDFGSVRKCQLSFEKQFSESEGNSGILTVEEIGSNQKISAHYSIFKNNGGYNDYLLTLSSPNEKVELLNSTLYLRSESETKLRVIRTGDNATFYLLGQKKQ
jgi:hypothetical protein